MARLLEDWLTNYLAYTKRSEPPVQYKTWVGISVIAAALQRTVWIDWGDIIFPNMYIVLVGPPGKCRKGTAMQMGRWFLDKLQIPLAAEKITIEALSRDLADSVKSTEIPSANHYMRHCSLSIFASELVVFTGASKISNIDLISVMIDWFDCKDRWVYKTKNKGEDVIEGVFVNLCGGTTPVALGNSIVDTSGTGLGSRIIFVVAREKDHYESFPALRKWEKDLRDDLLHDLEAIHMITGQYTFTAEAKHWYDNWYQNVSKAEEIDDPRFYGYSSRRSTHLRKLAIILAASESDDTAISVKDLKRAHNILIAVEFYMPQAFGHVGAWEYTPLMMEIHNFIMRTEHPVTQKEVNHKFIKEADIRSLEMIILQLERGDFIKNVGDITSPRWEIKKKKEEKPKLSDHKIDQGD